MHIAVDVSVLSDPFVVPERTEVYEKKVGDATNVGTVLPTVVDDIYLVAAAQALYGPTAHGATRTFAPRQMNRLWGRSIKRMDSTDQRRTIPLVVESGQNSGYASDEDEDMVNFAKTFARPYAWLDGESAISTSSAAHRRLSRRRHRKRRGSHDDEEEAEHPN